MMKHTRVFAVLSLNRKMKKDASLSNFSFEKTWIN